LFTDFRQNLKLVMHSHRFPLFALAAFLAAGLSTGAVAQTSSGSNSGSGNSGNASSFSRQGGGSVPLPAGQTSASSLAATSTINNLDLPATDPGYHLTNGDEIAVIVWGEADVSTDQRVDSKGVVRMPLIGDINLGSKTVREAEKYLEQIFVEKKILRKPMVTISVRDYAVREVSILGAVNSPGKYRMPKEAGSIEIIELITSLGGFKPTAKSDEVKVTRVDEAGIETVSTVNVEAMITGKGANKNSPKSFLVYPGDRIYVPERLF
jgi:polysaccharide export outer membrane protein